MTTNTKFPTATWAKALFDMAEDYEGLPEHGPLYTFARRLFVICRDMDISSDNLKDLKIDHIRVPVMKIELRKWYEEARDFALKYTNKPEQSTFASVARQFLEVYRAVPEAYYEPEEDPIGHMVVDGDLDDINSL